ncbi:BTB/POZ domain-containing protein 7-like [Ruditapes philippinarum]|uniref:BTB/POZ domain-containing protein 7-like n=1 Tax=Ruditapes philippinarum TaxID=129788 RepID=UPI00295C1576|nr:BTB/POZ domain-containing protein 7-like [Ruditapes philippinarum]XP_060571334.1 BTB/POZ domain-containing protein 7-like [Ruditapes philippinarum]
MGANVSFVEGSQSCTGSPSKLQTFSRLAHSYTVSDTDLAGKDKKKKASKFATLRKKLIRARRHSRSCDYGRALREFISSWSVRDISTLIHEYEALIAMKELAITTNLARPPANSFRHDFSHLYDFKFCTDIDLVYKGVCFPAHRALLSIRSPFFRDILSRNHESFPQIPIKLRTHGVDIVLFSVLLRYLYTDTLSHDELHIENRDILLKVATELGMPNPLDQDLQTLLDTGDYSDAVLVFSSELDLNESFSSEAGSSDGFSRTKYELPCHKAVLAARSPFFRNLLLRRARSGEDLTDYALNAPTRIVLDDSVIPRRYARVLLHAIYLDVVDLSLIMRGSASMCSLSEVQAIVAGKGQMTVVDEAMEMYQIGQFLDIPALSQGCEDIIADNITVDNLISVLTWSAEPHGSSWVSRQALHFLREEFIQVANSPVLFELSKSHLIETLSSDLLQAGELDVLTAVMKWGEHHLVRRIEKREPNLLSHTAHSVSKKGVKRRDLNDVELRDILAEILPLVRMDHVLPHNSDILTSAIRRGLVSTPPSHMISDDGGTNQIASAWIPGKNSGMFTRPRLFTPYYEEAKSVLEDRQMSGQDHELARVRPIQISSIPDTLYMVEDPQYIQQFMTYNPSPLHNIDIVSGTIPVPTSEMLRLMIQREQELQSLPQVQRAFSQSFIDRRSVMCQIKLRVVREFGWPDATVDVLQNMQYYYDNERVPGFVDRNYHATPSKRPPSPRLQLRRRKTAPTKPVQCVSPLSSPTKTYRPPLIESPSSSPNSDHDNSRSATLSSNRSTLSDTMPDIAMATASVNQLQLQDEYGPDIGDEGASRHGTLYI